MAGNIEIRLLRTSDDRSHFDSGNVEIDRFFRRYAGQNQFRHHLGVTYVACDSDNILGFFTVSVGHLEIEDLPQKQRRGLPRYPLPILRLARMAVARSARRRGIGKLLLRTVLNMARELATTVGCTGVVVDAKPETIHFYERFGFFPLEVVEGALASRPEPRPMFLPLTAIPTSAKVK